MGALDPAKIIMVLVIALIVLGPDRLPRVARQLGAAWREVTKFREHVEQEVRSAMPDLDLPKLPTRPSSAVASFLSDLTAPLKAPLADLKAAANGVGDAVTGDTASATNGAGGADGLQAVAGDDGATAGAPAPAPLNGAGDLNGAADHADPGPEALRPKLPDPIPVPPRGMRVLGELPVAPDDPSMN